MAPSISPPTFVPFELCFAVESNGHKGLVDTAEFECLVWVVVAEIF